MRALCNIPDVLITSRLPILLYGVAGIWFHGKVSTVGSQPWNFWKKAIHEKFGSNLWRRKREILFDSDKFYPNKGRNVQEFCLTQRNRLKAFASHLTAADVNQRILEKCEGNLEHAVKSRINIDEVSFETLVITMEDIVHRTNIGRKSENSFPKKSEDRRQPFQNKGKEPVKTPNSSNLKCNKCNKPGHFARDCRVRPVKQVEIMSEESVEQESEDADSDNSEHTNPEIGVKHLTFDTTDLYFPPVEDSASIMAISLDIEEGVDIEVVKADASLPQRWDPSKKLGHVVDARLLSSKPDRGKAYTAGESRFTTVLYEGKPVQILLDSGAECSIVSKRLMDRLNPKWEDDMLPISGIKFKSCSSPLEEMGIIETDLIFPHLKESVKIRPEFVVCRKANIDHFILGNEYFKMYGIDINNSKGTFFTIGGDNQKKKFLFDRGLVKYKLTTREKLAEAAHQADDGDLDLESVSSDTDCIQKIFKKDKQHATDADLESIHFSEAKVGRLLDPEQVEQLKDLCFKFKDCFATEDQPLSLI